MCLTQISHEYSVAIFEWIMSEMSGLMFSKYFAGLKNDTDKRRYQEKVSLLGCQEDPYCQIKQKGGCTQSVKWVDKPSAC